MDDLSEIATIWRAETLRSIKSGRALVLGILFLLFVGLSLTIVGFLSRSLMTQTPGMDLNAPGAAEQMLAMKKGILKVVVTEDEALLDLLAALPVVLLAAFKVTLRFLTLFIALMGFDQLAGEVGPKSIRYLVVRAKRSSIILGKLLSQVTLFGALMTLSVVMMMIVTRVLNPEFLLGDIALWTARMLLASFVLGFAYLTLTALFSAFMKQSAVALVLNIIALFVIWFVALIGEWFRFPGEAAAEGSLAFFKTESAFAYLRYLSVWHYGDDLLHPSLGRFFAAALVHVGFALIFLGLAHLALKRRDL